MTTRYYAKKTVDKLKAQLHLAEQNFNSTLADNEKLADQIKEKDDHIAQLQERIQKQNTEIRQYERSSDNQAVYSRAAEEKKKDFLQTCAFRAHNELMQVKPGEMDAGLLQRVIGNVQGALAAALDVINMGAPYTNLYPRDNLVAKEFYRNGSYIRQGDA